MVRFAVGSSVLDADAVATVRQTASSVLGIGTAITVTGYTDARGARPANVDLAKRRAAAVRTALIAAGVEPARIRLVAPVDVTGSGSATEARRVDIGLSQ